MQMGIVINMVVGGEVVTLKSLEESSNLVIAEMPIHVSLSVLTFPTFHLAILFLSVSRIDRCALFDIWLIELQISEIL